MEGSASHRRHIRLRLQRWPYACCLQEGARRGHQGTGAAEGVPGTTGQNRILASVKPSSTAREHPRFEESESAWRVTAAMATARPTSTGLPTSLASGCETRRDLAFKPKGLCMAKNTICLWYDKDAEAAARFYAETFPD